MAPELVHNTILALLVAGIEPDCAGAQCIDQQAVRAPGMCGKEVIPSRTASFQATTGNEPIELVKAQQILLQINGLVLLGGIEIERPLQMESDPGRSHGDGWQMHT